MHCPDIVINRAADFKCGLIYSDAPKEGYIRIDTTQTTFYLWGEIFIKMYGARELFPAILRLYTSSLVLGGSAADIFGEGPTLPSNDCTAIMKYAEKNAQGLSSLAGTMD